MRHRSSDTSAHQTACCRWQSIDTIVLAVAFAVGARIGISFLHDAGVLFFYQTQMPATVMYACGHGFLQPADTPPALLDFLFLRTREFDCAHLHDIIGTRDPGNIATVHLYLAAAVAALWRWLGVSYQNLWPLTGALYGAYAAGGYAFARLFFGRWIALAVATAITLSPMSISMLFFLRDFAKAPFILWTMVLLVLAMRQQNRARLTVVTLLAALSIGVGTGFRSDVLILLPVALGIFILGLDRTSVWQRFALASALAVAVLGILSVTTARNTTGGVGSLIMQGATEPFRAHLGLPPAPYDLGFRYLDELTFSTIAADLRRADPARFDLNESRPFENVSQAMRESTRYVLDWIYLFPADLATRAIKAAALIAGFPAMLAENRRSLDPYKPPYPGASQIASITAPLWRPISQPWMPLVGVAGLLAFVLRIFAWSRREAACVAGALLVLASVPSIQFSMRHFFHLEFLFWFGLAALVSAPFEWAKLRRHLLAFVGWVAAFLLLGATVYFATVVLQDRLLKREIRGLLDSRREPIAMSIEPLPEDEVLAKIPVPVEYQSLISSEPDSMSMPTVETVPIFDVRAAADRLEIVVGGANCAPGLVEIKLSYAKRPQVWQPLDNRIALFGPGGSGATTSILTSGIYRPTQHLGGLQLKKDRLSCLVSVARVRGKTRLPAVFSAILPPDWPSHPLHLKLSGGTVAGIVMPNTGADR